MASGSGGRAAVPGPAPAGFWPPRTGFAADCELHRTARQDASGAESDAENARLSAIAEASWLLAAERAAEEEAKERRLAAELAATEAAERARREQEQRLRLPSGPARSGGSE